MCMYNAKQDKRAFYWNKLKYGKIDHFPIMSACNSMGRAFSKNCEVYPDASEIPTFLSEAAEAWKKEEKKKKKKKRKENKRREFGKPQFPEVTVEF